MGAQCEDSKKYDGTLLKIVETFQNFLRGDWCQPTQELSYGSELVLHFLFAVLRSEKILKSKKYQEEKLKCNRKRFHLPKVSKCSNFLKTGE